MSDTSKNSSTTKAAPKASVKESAGTDANMSAGVQGGDNGESFLSKFFKNFDKTKRKFYLKITSGLLIIFVGFQGYSWLFSPFVGAMDYGMCKVFLELNVRYPDSLRLSHVQNFGQSVRIWYTQLDSFGQYRMESIQCYYRPDPVTGAAIDKATINRREIDPDIIDRFNVSIPAIIAHQPDLTYPRDFPNNISDLRLEE